MLKKCQWGQSHIKMIHKNKEKKWVRKVPWGGGGWSPRAISSDPTIMVISSLQISILIKCKISVKYGIYIMSYYTVILCIFIRHSVK